MSRIFKKVLSVFFVTAFAFSSLYCAFLEPGYGSRGTGKGGAFVATADDASAPEWNPAALANISSPEGMFEYYSPFTGLPGVSLGYSFASFVYPVSGIANFGLSYAYFSGDDIYSHSAFRFSLAKDLTGLVPSADPSPLSAGVSFRLLEHKFHYREGEEGDLDDPLWDKGSSAGAFSADFGLLFEPSGKVPIGLSVKNIIPADVGIKDKDPVPAKITAGAGYRFDDVSFFKEIVPEINISYRDQYMGDTLDKINFSAGAEAWLDINRNGVRMGFNRDELAFGVSYGWIIDYITLRLDYSAFIPYSNIEGHSGHHRFSTSVKF